ncbi:MAG: DNA polymerase III subunit epsilon [Lachnospiraceae bacterium]|nr:DNA polymerase III subunit epsilon [Lachnospiraceae bacterium]
MAQDKGRLLGQYVEDYAVFDLETTGISWQRDAIIEISAIRVRGHRVSDQYSTLVNPQRHIPAAASRVNHITDGMVERAPLLAEAMEGFLDFIGDDILVGHNIQSFDMKFINQATNTLYGREVGNDRIDTLILARQCLPGLSRHRLLDVAGHFGISTQGAHRALQDCIMNQQCYERLGKMLQEQGTEDKGVVCPKCGAMMVKRKGMFGEFYGCSSFPRCRGTRNL